MRQTIRLKIKKQRKLEILPQVRKVRVHTNDAVIVVSPTEFLRIGSAEKYVFIYDMDDKTFEISANNLESVR